MTERERKYRRYLRSAHWKRLRYQVFRRAAGFCERCGILRAEHCHHKTYERFSNELLEDLEAVCVLCHSKIHGRLIPDRPPRTNPAKARVRHERRRSSKAVRRQIRRHAKARRASHKARLREVRRAEFQRQQEGLKDVKNWDMRQRILSGAYFG